MHTLMVHQPLRCDGFTDSRLQNMISTHNSLLHIECVRVYVCEFAAAASDEIETGVHLTDSNPNGDAVPTCQRPHTEKNTSCNARAFRDRRGNKTCREMNSPTPSENSGGFYFRKVFR